MQLFHSALNDRGRAGFVMANSAGDARGSEQLIRQKMIEDGSVDVIVSIGSNFFYTVTLPCTLWFFDKGSLVGDGSDLAGRGAQKLARTKKPPVGDIAARRRREDSGKAGCQRASRQPGDRGQFCNCPVSVGIGMNGCEAAGQWRVRKGPEPASAAGKFRHALAQEVDEQGL
jgi:hypothetical protein